MLDSRLEAFKEMIETLKKNNFDDDFLEIRINKKTGGIVIDTPVESYTEKTLDSTISRALENLQDDIDNNISYWEDMEEMYKRDREAEGIGSW